MAGDLTRRDALGPQLRGKIPCAILCLPFAFPRRGRMTPEEMNRTIAFIIESQARLAAAQEQDRQDRVQFQDWSKKLDAKLARILNRQSELLHHQSQRMDRLDKFYEDALAQAGDFQKQVLDLQKQALHLLNLILDRLPPLLFHEAT